MKSQLVRDLGGRHGIRQILFVGKDEQQGITQFIFVEHSLEFIAGFSDTIPVVGIDYEYNAWIRERDESKRRLLNDQIVDNQ